MSLGAERRFPGNTEAATLPLTIGVSIHIRGDTTIISRIDKLERTAVVRLAGSTLAGATLFLSRDGLAHIRDALTATLNDLDAA